MANLWALCKPTKIGDQFQTIDKDYVKEQKNILNNAKNVWERTPEIKKLGWHENGTEFVNRFQEATLKDPFLHKVTQGDVVVFKEWMKEFNNGLSKDMGTASAWVDWKLLRFKTKYLPDGSNLADKILNVTDYQRRFLQGSTTKLDNIHVSLKSLSKSMGIDMKDLSKLEQAYASIDPSFTVEKEAALNNIKEYMGSLNSFATKEKAGEVILGLNELMAGKRPSELRKTVDGEFVPWNNKEQSFATELQDNFFSIRKDMTKVAINGLRFQLKNAEAIDKSENNRRNLAPFLKEIEAMIIQFETTQNAPSRVGKTGELSGIVMYLIIY